MSKPVRLPEYLYAEIQKLAAQEKRSLANMVQVLLDQALALDEMGVHRIHDSTTGELVGMTMPGPVDPDAPVVEAREVDPHFKPDFK